MTTESKKCSPSAALLHAGIPRCVFTQGHDKQSCQVVLANSLGTQSLQEVIERIIVMAISHGNQLEQAVNGMKSW